MIELEYKKSISKALIAFLVVVSLFFVVKLFSEWKVMGAMGSMNSNTITLSGHGEVQAVPDIANVYFTVESSKSTQKESSDEVNTKVKSVLDFLKSSDVAEKDIKTEGYDSYPKYSRATPCPLYYSESGIMPPCNGGESKIIGYTVSQRVTVKIRKVDDVSVIIDGINKIGVTNMSGPSFSVDDEDGLKAEARKKAIDDAREKAEVLAKDLGVRLGRIANFNESGGGYYPMYDGGMEVKNMAMTESTPSELPKGENTINANVSITYEIR